MYLLDIVRYTGRELELTKESGRRTPIIELTPDLLHILEKQYEEDRSMQISFSAFVRSYLYHYIRKQRFLARAYPKLRVILSDPDKGFFIKDQENGVIAEIKENLEDAKTTGLFSCSVDKDKDLCPHIEYALLSFELMNAIVIDNRDDKGHKKAPGTTRSKEARYIIT